MEKKCLGGLYEKGSNVLQTKVFPFENRIMTKTARQSVFALSAILACALLVLAGGVDAFRQLQSPAISSQQHSRSLFVDNSLDLMNSIRGGSIDVEIESSDEEETDDEEEEVSTLAKSAKKATTKAVKKKVTVAMTAKPTRKKPSSLGTFFKVPYILKACLNPFVFWQMTAGYWKSLYNINYMAENVSFTIDLLFLPLFENHSK